VVDLGGLVVIEPACCQPREELCLAVQACQHGLGKHFLVTAERNWPFRCLQATSAAHTSYRGLSLI